MIRYGSASPLNYNIPGYSSVRFGSDRFYRDWYGMIGYDWVPLARCCPFSCLYNERFEKTAVLFITVPTISINVKLLLTIDSDFFVIPFLILSS